VNAARLLTCFDMNPPQAFTVAVPTRAVCLTRHVRSGVGAAYPCKHLMKYLVRSYLMLSLLGLSLFACADVPDDDVAASESKLQKLADLDDAEDTGNFHEAGDCPHIATYRSKLQQDFAQTGCASCHNPGNTRAALLKTGTRGTGTTTVSCQQCHVSGQGKVGVTASLDTLQQGSATSCSSAACHGPPNDAN
jgi:hypothetical protein